MSGPAERLLLVGMMGAGKTTVGAALADRIGWAFVDSDAEVVTRAGRSVAEIWNAGGEAAFRAEETAALAALLSRPGRTVVGVAGGAVLDPANRDLIRAGGPVVWLRAGLATLAARVGSGAGRPLLDADPAGNLRRLDTERRALYADLADLVVDVDGLDPGQVAELIVTELRGSLGQCAS